MGTPTVHGKVTVVTIPQPTANGPLHVGHLAGPYLAADMAIRAARARGERVLALTGADIHQNHVLTRAENEGVEPGAMIAAYRAEIATSYRLARIGYDAFLDPQDSGYQNAVTGMIADLVTRGALPIRPVRLLICGDCGRTMHHSYVAGECPRCGSGASGGTCEVCGTFTSAQNLVNPVCDRCGGTPRVDVMDLPVLAMERHRDALIKMWLGAELPGRVREMIRYYLATGLPDIPIAYPTNWGLHTPMPLSGLRVCVWAEVGLSYVYGVGHALDPAANDLDGYVAAWREVEALWQFHGIDNVFYNAVFWPALFHAIGFNPAPLAGLVVNEFYTLDGRKFSTSRKHAVWANDLLANENPEIVRLYLAWDRPDRYGSDFTIAAYREFADRVAPLLARHAPVAAGMHVPGSGEATEIARGEQALRLAGFDTALAARCLLACLERGSDGGTLRASLTGHDTAAAHVGGREQAAPGIR